MVTRCWAVLALALLLPSIASAKPWRAVLAPGDVGQDHKEVEDQCERCHLPFKGIPDDKCLACHTEIERRQRSKIGYHASVRAQPCIDCHGDHQGRAATGLTKAPARAAFNHRATGFELRGAHEKVACEACHDKPIAQVSSACAPCHADPHKGALGAACERCHDSAAWKAGIKTLAEHKVPTSGGHAELGCKDCHDKGANLKAQVACASCHEEYHGGTKASCDTCHSVSGFKPAKFDHDVCTCVFPGKHQTFECLACHKDWKFTPTPTRCSGCHAKELKHEQLGECSLCHSALSWKKKDAFDHNKRSRFKIEGSHQSVDCSQCHTKPGQFRGAATTCQGCHLEQGREAHGDFGDCAKCHTVESFSSPTFDHATTGFVLSGRHEKLACQDCHADKTRGYPGKPKRPAVLWPPRAPRLASAGPQDALRIASWLATTNAPAAEHAPEAACVHCHVDEHRGQVGTDCASCHGTEVWRPSTFDVARHEATKLPLAGRHQEVACRLCHAGGQLKDLPLDCAGCHLDPHAGKLGTECARCHTVTGFRPVEGFDHALTGFLLIGPHATAKCESCHAGARGEALAKAEEVACVTCHVPPHGPELGADCGACHPLSLKDGLAVRFSAARGMAFPEHVATGFPLERRHRAQTCGSCHPAAGPPPEPRCASCHVDPHGGQLGQQCADCHQADRWRLARFDHDRTGWVLRGRHFVTPCASCHTSQRWLGLTTECFDCHARDAARAKQRVGLHEFGPSNCRDCHFSLWRW